MAELAVEVGDLGREDARRDDALVVETVTRHAAALLRTARRHSLCLDDAHDAYQRALEIFLRRAGHLPPEDVDLLMAVARVVLVAARGSLAQQLASMGERPVW